MAAFLDPPMHHYFAHKFSSLPKDELRVRIEETLKFLFVSHECTGAIPVTKEIDEIWHAVTDCRSDSVDHLGAPCGIALARVGTPLGRPIVFTKFLA
jgi:hypothetical protein